MKLKTLRRKHENPEYREFASIAEWGGICTHQHPQPLGEGATIEGLKGVAIGCKDVNWDEYEIVEIDYHESGVIGADIRNKLSPMKGLVSLLEVYFDQPESVKRDKLLQYIRREMNQTKINVEYLAKLID
jgi:hypothetical protein